MKRVTEDDLEHQVNSLLQNIVEASADAIFVHRFDGQFLYVNDAACSMLGYTREELKLLHPWDFVVNDSPEYIQALWHTMVPNVRVLVEGEFRSRDGTLIPAEVRLVRFSHADADWIVAYCRDVTYRRRSENALLGEERNRIARDLHDTLAHGLTAIAVQLEAARHIIGADTELLAGHVNNALKLARESLRDLRDSVRAIRPAAVETRSLADAVQQLVSSRSIGRPEKLQFRLDGETRTLPAKFETHLLRIAQEALMNVLKHASAKNVLVELCYTGQDCRLSVQDDGCGFNLQQVKADGMGLLGMKERAEDMGAAFQIESAGDVTKVSVVVRSTAAGEDQ